MNASYDAVVRPGAEPRGLVTGELEAHRAALTGYCYRMLGCGAEAEDAVQETMIRAWRNADKLQHRAALRGWLFRIAGNVCFDMLEGGRRRAQPMDLGPASAADAALGAGLPESTWVRPIADERVLDLHADPADLMAARETLRLAFVAALQHLPPRQRAVLVLREALRWRAEEVADLLETSVASVNSALQRARATLGSLDLDPGAVSPGGDGGDPLLQHYIEAFEAYDIERLVTLLREDAAFSMPPFPLWVRGPADIAGFMLGTGAKCRGSRVLPVSANGGPAAAIYNPAGDGSFTPWAVVVLETDGRQITGLHHFLYPELFARFGLPERLPSPPPTPTSSA